MAATFKFELVSPERILIDADAEQVVVPGGDGEFTVLPGHAPVISTLRPGILDIQLPGERTRVLVKGGFAEVVPESLTVLAAHAIAVDDLDAAQIADEIEAAEAALAEARDDAARTHATDLLTTLRSLAA